MHIRVMHGLHKREQMNEFSAYWESMDKLFDKLKTIPAKDFIKLYYLMQGMINNHERYDNVYISNPDNLGSITTAISGR